MLDAWWNELGYDDITVWAKVGEGGVFGALRLALNSCSFRASLFFAGRFR